MLCQSAAKNIAITAIAVVSAAMLPIATTVPLGAQESVAKIMVDWTKVTAVSKTTPTLQVVVNPMLRPGSPIVENSYAAIRGLGADYVRYVPWLPYPKLAVAELTPPTSESTSWDFSLIDPMTIDFLNATKGHPAILNFSTIPQWMFKTEKPVAFPSDPNQPTWNYTQGTELRDPSMKELGDYYARLVMWYTKGEFTDELGKKHVSGYHYSLPYWEVLNEVEFEHKMTPEQYTARYDAIVSAIKEVSPGTQFVGLALAAPSVEPQYFEYFLNPKNHKPGIPLDMVSYHFYANATPDQTIDDWQYTFFDQANGFLNTVRYAESIRKRLSPSTKTDLDELGIILPSDEGQDEPNHVEVPIPPRYWNLAGGMYAYLYIQLAKIGIDVAGESQLVGYPTQYPSVSMMNWNGNGKPNARFWVLKLLKDNFGPGDKLVETKNESASAIEAQSFATTTGNKLLLINKRNKPIPVELPAELANGAATFVDESTGDEAPHIANVSGNTTTLAPFSVMVIKVAK
jgi:hypothetical protein